MASPPDPPPGWYRAKGDPPGTRRYWDGSSWPSGPVPVSGLDGPSIDHDLAGLSARVRGRAVDLVIWAAIATLAAVAGVGFSPGGPDDRNALGLAALAGAAIVAYEALTVGLRGATVGKGLAGTRVVKVDGSAADVPTGLRRASPIGILTLLWLVPALGWVVSAAALLLVVVGLVMIDADGRQQAPWDKLGTTLVVRDPARGDR